MKDINKKVIIDFGANKGQNINYYLLKADIVVCVEANPELVKAIQKKFSVQIRNNKLFVENVVVTKKENSRKLINFYINKNDVLSSNIKPKNSKDFHLVKVQNKSVNNHNLTPDNLAPALTMDALRDHIITAIESGERLG